MSAKIDLTGQRFGRLTVVEEAGRNKHSCVLWRCLCDCGGSSVVSSGSLRSGHTESCGCLQKEATVNRLTTHGGVGTRLYRIWDAMRNRCRNPKNSRYKDYGGRGITVCPEWDDFAAFRDWALANGYRDDLTIDRIDNDSGYRPDNCRWATMSEQRRNRRPYKKKTT